MADNKMGHNKQRIKHAHTCAFCGEADSQVQIIILVSPTQKMNGAVGSSSQKLLAHLGCV